MSKQDTPYRTELRTLTDDQLQNVLTFWGERVARFPAEEVFFRHYQNACEEQMRRIRERNP